MKALPVLTLSDFPTFFTDVYGKPPFSWQVRLSNWVAAEQRWPSMLSLPTSSGKTALIDIATFLLALQADDPARTAATRLFFVVDRRLVVDQAAERAEKLAEKLESAKGGILRRVADRLLSFGTGKPLAVAKLRGGIVYEHPWCQDPRQPLIVTSTVDQVGSRLLFRGYGCSNSRLPLEAGLVANDSLIVVDEAHLSQPFLETLSAVRRHGPRLTWVRMSGTAHQDEDSFRLEADDYRDRVLEPRLNAKKLARLDKLNDLSALPEAAVTAASELSARANVVGVIVNTVDTARRIFESLRTGRDQDAAVLLIGRVRPYDRDQVLAEWLPRMAVGRDRKQDRTMFVVATQTVEVGADIDFDALVTEAAPLDALRQRFGRLDRLGEIGETAAVVIQSPNPIPAYGEAPGKTWSWLNRKARTRAGVKTIDFGVGAMDSLIETAGTQVLEKLYTPRSHAPPLLPTHIEAWCQTSPIPEADPAVAPFLHGAEAFDADEVAVVWRADLEEDWLLAVELAPPDVRETMPVALYAVREWLGDREALIWRGPDDKRTAKRTARAIRPGDTVVVPSDYGGSDVFGWFPQSNAPVNDLGDQPGRWVRLHPALVEPEVAAAVKELIHSSGDLELDGLEVLLEQAGIGGVKLESATRYGSGIIVRRQRDLRAEDDARSAMAKPVLLSEHLAGVARCAEVFSRGCLLSAEERNAVLSAARLHDLGKLDPRFQALLNRGDLLTAYRAIAEERALAKSGGAWSIADYRRYRTAAGYPEGARHEAASVKFAEMIGETALCLHLIAAHHGRARPWMQAWNEDSGILLRARVDNRDLGTGTGHDLGSVDSKATERFWSLCEEFGPWRLAYLEAILRMADQRRSQEECDA